MSLLGFLGLSRRNYNRTRLTLADILHRTVVSGLAALSVYGLFLGYMVHKETLAKGQGVWKIRMRNLYRLSIFSFRGA